MKWKDITLRQYEDIQLILTEEGDELKKLVDIATMLFNLDSNIPVLDMTQYFKQVQELLDSRIATKVITKQYKIGNNTYCLSRINLLTLALFMDFQAVAVEPDNTAKLISTMLVPVGHEYNQGYDIEDVVEDIYNMSIEDVFSIINFQTGLLKK